jgi:hypothetical protein
MCDESAKLAELYKLALTVRRDELAEAQGSGIQGGLVEKGNSEERTLQIALTTLQEHQRQHGC